MPPFVPRKRHASPAPETRQPPQKRPAPSKPTTTKKATLFDTADAKPSTSRSVEDNKAFLAKLVTQETTISEGDSDEEFEDVLPKAANHGIATKHEEHDDEEMDWEDAIGGAESSTLTAPTPRAHEPSGDLELTLNALPTNVRGSLTNNSAKKGPSKIERQIRTSTHCLHVQFLMYHNLIRNGWACDKEVQKMLVGGLSPGCKQEYERWIKACGAAGVAVGLKSLLAPTKKSDKGKGKKGQKNQRDWGRTAGALEEGSANLSQGDPILRLLKTLSAYWRKRFSVTAPGLRKQGYKDLSRLEEEMKSFRSDKRDPEMHGEHIADIKQFRELAKACEGSRDVGAQLFTALLRGLGLEARMVASLQPIGFGWSKGEDAHPPRKKGVNTLAEAADNKSDEIEDDSDISEEEAPVKKKQKKAAPSKTKANTNSTSKGVKDAPIDITEDESELSDAPSSEADDDASIIDVTPAKSNRSSKKYDYDLPSPTYWTEVLSPLSNIWIPVDPIVLNVISGSLENHLVFEPRGARADKAKQVMSYVVGFSADGTAKDVTVRYLKRRMWPGKTKGVRMPVEKVPVYNKRGKILRTEEYDWFKDVMRGYARDGKKRTPADTLEDAKDLLAVRLTKEATKASEETLQGYKTSAEFVLERHLRREEALLPHAAPVKHFTTGKGDKAKSEPVYLRADVAVCRTVESWHKEGREVKPDMAPLKHVPVRAVTLVRKREIEEAERESGEKLKQGLFSREQTHWIIPPAIVNGAIPKNAFGNMDVYVPTMVPQGAVHVRLKGTAKICRRLGIDYAEAVTGFEFGNKRAVPVITGVVVAAENKGMLVDAWRVEEVEKRKKEDAKREKVALGMWRKMLAGLRIVERVRREYGQDAEAHIEEAIHPMAAAGRKKKAGKGKDETKSGGTMQEPMLVSDDEDEAGGFLPEESDGEYGGGGFLPDGYREKQHSHDESVTAGGFILDDEHSLKKPRKSVVSEPLPRMPISLQDLQDHDAEAEEVKIIVPTKTKAGRANSAPKRASVPKPKVVVKSKYFPDSEEESDDDDDDDDDDDAEEEDHQKKQEDASVQAVSSRSKRSITGRGLSKMAS